MRGSGDTLIYMVTLSLAHLWKWKWVQNESGKHLPDEWASPYLTCTYIHWLCIGKCKKIQEKSSGGGEIPKNVIYRAIDLLNAKMTTNAMWKPVHKNVELTIFGRHVGIGTVSKEISCFWNGASWERRYIDICGHGSPMHLSSWQAPQSQVLRDPPHPPSYISWIHLLCSTSAYGQYEYRSKRKSRKRSGSQEHQGLVHQARKPLPFPRWVSYTTSARHAILDVEMLPSPSSQAICLGTCVIQFKKKIEKRISISGAPWTCTPCSKTPSLPSMTLVHPLG